MTKEVITGPAAALVNLKRLSAIAAGVVLTAAVGIATPSSARTVIKNGQTTVYKNNGTVKSTKTETNVENGTTTTTKTTTKPLRQ